ncbi:hypothetical protein C7212DRAFT_294757 [Tuber magnatum]|uniref:Uncharacterized protein n=1 Tax=Tuber magnatum TaxID=42249 RepID=A0A317SRC3_9PEZI|nr:hypothetical protein C7212DRAFT_294757 [Tuber magnatum]
MPRQLHELGSREFAHILRMKAHAMGLGWALCDIGTVGLQAATSKKEPDPPLKPTSRSGRTHSPTVAFECGVSESLRGSRADSRWWLDNSGGELKIALLFSVSEPQRTIHIEQWEEQRVPNPHASRRNPGPFSTRPTKVHEVDITGPVSEPVASGAVRGSPVTLDFAKIFLRQPGPGEGNIVFTIQDLQQYAKDVWSAAALGNLGI